MALRPGQFAKKTAIVAYQIHSNWRSKSRYDSGNHDSFDGSTHSRLTLSESLDYIDQVFSDYLAYSDIAIEDLQDKRILEIGPGDSLGVALMFLASGAARVVCMDKFSPVRDLQQQRRIYDHLARQLGDHSGRLSDMAIGADTGMEVTSDRLRCVYGHGIEEASHLLEPGSFDFIVSRTVLEEVYDIDDAFSAMDKLLVPGGFMIHKIDFRDLGVFSGHGMHPLTFLTVSDSVYRLMAADSGKPNRRLVDYYRQKMTELAYDTKILVTHIVGQVEELVPHKEQLEPDVDYTDATIAILDEIRPRLNKEFKALPDEELMVSGIFLVAKKPE